MFDTRISQSWGAGGTILREFLLERLVEDDGTGIAIFLARRKATGQRVWLKCQLNNVDSVLLATEAAVWDGLAHPNILSPAEIAVEAGKPYLVYPWSGDVTLESLPPQTLNQLDRLRIALGLVRAVQYLQSTDTPVAHTRLSESNIWLTQVNRWPNLVGFEYALSSPDPEALKQDRRDCWRTVQRIVGAADGLDVNGRVEQAADEWTAAGRDSAPAFLHELERVLVSQVTANL